MVWLNGYKDSDGFSGCSVLVSRLCYWLTQLLIDIKLIADVLGWIVGWLEAQLPIGWLYWMIKINDRWSDILTDWRIVQINGCWIDCWRQQHASSLDTATTSRMNSWINKHHIVAWPLVHSWAWMNMNPTVNPSAWHLPPKQPHFQMRKPAKCPKTCETQHSEQRYPVTLPQHTQPAPHISQLFLEWLSGSGWRAVDSSGSTVVQRLSAVIEQWRFNSCGLAAEFARQFHFSADTVW